MSGIYAFLLCVIADELTDEKLWKLSRHITRGVLVSVKFGCFSPSRFSHFHCNTMRKAIKAHKNLHTNQQNEHTPVHQNCTDLVLLWAYHTTSFKLYYMRTAMILM